MGRDPVLLRARLLLALFLPALYIALPTASGSGGIATVLTAGFAAALVVAVVLQVRLGVEASPTAVRTLSLRERAKLTVFLRLRDPDARGRTRPRAPGFGSAAA
jgi:hypothetical protein